MSLEVVPGRRIPGILEEGVEEQTIAGNLLKKAVETAGLDVGAGTSDLELLWSA
jgi:hypothetical protein